MTNLKPDATNPTSQPASLLPCPFCGSEIVSDCAECQEESLKFCAACRSAQKRKLAEVADSSRAERTCYSERTDCFECSECGFFDAYAAPSDFNFCPICGARVVEE